MCIRDRYHIPIGISLGIIGVILVSAIGFSLYKDGSGSDGAGKETAATH